MRRSDSCGKTLMRGKVEGRRRRGWQRMGWLDDITFSGSWWWTGRPSVLWFMGSQRVGLSDWTELNWMKTCCLLEKHLHKIKFFGNIEASGERWKTFICDDRKTLKITGIDSREFSTVNRVPVSTKNHLLILLPWAIYYIDFGLQLKYY